MCVCVCGRGRGGALPDPHERYVACIKAVSLLLV